MSRRRAAIFATITTLIGAMLLCVVAFRAFAPVEWVRVDRPVPGIVEESAVPGDPLATDEPFELEIDVPSTGLARVDLKFDVTGLVPSTDPDDVASLDFKVVDVRTGRTLWVNGIDLDQIDSGGVTVLAIPEITQRTARTVRLRVELRDVPDATSVQPWTLPCDCSRMIRLVGRPDEDAEAAIYSRVEGRPERLDVLLDRLDRLNGTGFGPTAFLLWGGAAAAFSLVLFWLIAYLILRHELTGFRVEAERARAASRGERD